MALEFHGNAEMQFDQQYENAKNYIIPFIQTHLKLGKGVKVMDIGCGEGGVLKAFYEVGCTCLGVDLSPMRVENAKNLQKEAVDSGNLNFIARDIYQFPVEEENSYDLIIFKDSIEHIPDQPKIIAHVRKFLKPTGQIFFGFPPWFMPFGGHQQICSNKWLSKLPYYHLLPVFLYKSILKMGKEDKDTIDELLEIKSLGLTTSHFQSIFKNAGYEQTERKLWLINPIYQYKFKLKPRVQFSWLSFIPYFRDYFTTTAYYLIKPKK